jgi:hypothetical protein
MPKDYLKLVEKIVSDYHLEDDLIEDRELNEKLLQTENIQEKIFLKLFFSKKTKNIDFSNASLESASPSFALCRIIESLLNKKLPPTEIKKVIIEKLKISEEKAAEISQKVLTDEYILKEIDRIKNDKLPQGTTTEKKFLGLSQDLVK